MSAFLISNSVSVANGSTTVTVTGGVDCGQVVSGTAVIINGEVVEGKSGTAPNAGGTSTITLALPWPFANASAARMVAFNTFEGMVAAIQSARQAAVSASSALNAFDAVLTGTTATVTIDINGVPVQVTPYGYLVAQAQPLIDQLESSVGAIGPLQDQVDDLEAQVAAQQGIVSGNLTASQAAATSAANSATAAAGSATSAANSATAAANSATSAANDAASITGAVSAAQTAATTATTKADEAQDSAELAEKWADNPENTPVVTGKFSAKHHAAKAEYWAGQAAGSAAGALVLSGTYNASSNTFPPSPTAGQVYEVSAGGTLGPFDNTAGNVAVVPGDLLIKTVTGWFLVYGYRSTVPTTRGGTGRTDGKAAGLATARSFSITGKATAAAVQFDGGGNVELNVTALTFDGEDIPDLRRAKLFGLIGMLR